MGSNQRRLSRRFYRPLSFSTSQSAADQRICAVQMRFSISYASMISEFGKPARPRTRSREATDGADGSGYVERPPPGCPAAGRTLHRRKRPGCAADDTPRLVTPSKCQRQRLSRCSWQRVPQCRVAGRRMARGCPGGVGLATLTVVSASRGSACRELFIASATRLAECFRRSERRARLWVR